MAEFSVSTRRKLASSIRLLASDREGEILAAARAIPRALKAAGADIHTLAALVEQTGGGELSEAEMKKLYGLDNPATKAFGEQCLAARRLVERGVRFVQVFHGSNVGAGAWDAHSGLKANHAGLCPQVDQPIAALLTDLKQRGLLNETIVVWGSEFGRTPGAERSDGRDHHPYGFSAWLAGGGIKAGVAHGAMMPVVLARQSSTSIAVTPLPVSTKPIPSTLPSL